MAYVRLTDPAIVDLQALFKLDPSILGKVFTKMLLLELDTNAGEPLVGMLVKWRKLTVGDRTWRIIWIPTEDAIGELVLDIAQVWAVGARSDSEIYQEMKIRLAAAPVSPKTTALSEVLAMFGGKLGDIPAASEPVDEPAPTWLLARLEYMVGLSREKIRGLSVEQAMELWDQYKSGSK